MIYLLAAIAGAAWIWRKTQKARFEGYSFEAKRTGSNYAHERFLVEVFGPDSETKPIGSKTVGFRFFWARWHAQEIAKAHMQKTRKRSL